MSAQPAAPPLVPFERAAVAQPDRGKRVKQRDYLAEGRIPVIDQGQSPVGGYTNDDDFAFIGELPVVLFGDHTRAVKLVDQRFAVGADGIKIFRPAEGVRAKYLYYWMKSAPLPDRGYGRHYQYLRQLSLPLPPPKHQDEIVAELEKQFSRLDEAVANLKRVKANLKHYKAAVLRAAVEGRLVLTEAELARREHRGYETGAQLLQRIRELHVPSKAAQRQTDLDTGAEADAQSTLPDGWVWATVEQLGIVQLGRQRSPKNRSKSNPVKYIRAANITEFGLNLADTLDMEFSLEEQERFRLRRGDLVLSEASGSPDQVGKPAVWQDELPLCCFQNTVIRLRPVVDMSAYLLICFQSYYANGVFARVASGVGINHLSAARFSRILVPVPPLAEQHRIVESAQRVLTHIGSLAEELERSRRRADHLHEHILASAFGAQSGSYELRRPEMERPKLPSLPPPRKAEAEDHRLDLEEVLKKYATGLSVEQLFLEAGYLGDQVDVFYRDLSRLADRLDQSAPDSSQGPWPLSGSITIKLRT